MILLAAHRRTGGVLRAATAALALVGLLAFAGCATGPKISVTGAVTSEAGGSDELAVYLRISNAGDEPDELVWIQTPEAVAAHLHESEIDTSGVASMSTIKPLQVPPGGSVELRPGAEHVMLMQPKPLRAGDHFTLTLSFSRSGDITTRVDVVTPDELVDRTEGAA